MKASNTCGMNLKRKKRAEHKRIPFVVRSSFFSKKNRIARGPTSDYGHTYAYVHVHGGQAHIIGAQNFMVFHRFPWGLHAHVCATDP